MEHCHALLMLGTDFPYRPFYPDDVMWKKPARLTAVMAA
jgi:hypothetical protein